MQGLDGLSAHTQFHEYIGSCLKVMDGLEIGKNISYNQQYDQNFLFFVLFETKNLRGGIKITIQKKWKTFPNMGWGMGY